MRRTRSKFFFHLLLTVAILPARTVLAQDLGTLHSQALPPLAHPDDPAAPAKQLFARALKPTTSSAEAIGFYAKGCLAGAQELPVTGDAWQVMRPSRNRNWGHPALVSFIERLARKVRADRIFPGLLIGDMAQPRGGPMINGHASHQVGLDADIWDRPMPDRVLTTSEREFMESVNIVRRDRLDVDPQKWTPQFMGLIRATAEQPEVQRIFVNPAIKKAICRDAAGDRSWLSKVRPYYGHDYHFHVRIACPANDPECRKQAPPPPGDGCDTSLAWWFSGAVLHPKPNPNYKPAKPITMAALPAECRRVLKAE
jgi:penicillin-insensitive murein endopeptidase